jgi:antitoxin VapB
MMALNIKDPQTDRLARELAELSGLPITSAVREAIEERLTVLRARARAVPPGLEDIIARGRSRATVDTRPEDEILGYDSNGLPA